MIGAGVIVAFVFTKLGLHVRRCLVDRSDPRPGSGGGLLSDVNGICSETHGHSCLSQTAKCFVASRACRRNARSAGGYARTVVKPPAKPRGRNLGVFSRSGPRRPVVRHQRPATLWEGCRKEGIAAKPGSQINDSKEFQEDSRRWDDET